MTGIRPCLLVWLCQIFKCIILSHVSLFDLYLYFALYVRFFLLSAE